MVKTSKQSIYVLLALGATILIGLLIFYGPTALRLASDSVFASHYEEFLTINVGMDRSEVIARLGQPHASFTDDIEDKRYPMKGYDAPNREVSAETLVYVHGEAICYVYLDSDGVVEDIFIGGS